METRVVQVCFIFCLLAAPLKSQQQTNGPTITTSKGELRISSPGNMVFEAGEGGNVEFRSSNGSGLVVGEKGMKGEKGDKGDMGDIGPTGPTGATGATGPQGSQGFKGDRGTNGRNGIDGSKGSLGTKGEKGQTGVRGVSATDSALITWNECVWQSLNDGRNYGQIASCTLNKARNDTWVRVSWNGNMRISFCTTCCMRWYFTINGEECADPGPIDSVIFQSQNIQVLRQAHILGVCRSTRSINGERVLEAGPVRVQFLVMECPLFGGFVYDAYTGWNSVSRITVEEIIPRETSTPEVRAYPPAEYVYQPNYCQYFYLHLEANRERNLGIIAQVIFKKEHDHTALRIAWEGNIRKRSCTGCCSRWWIEIDGAPCSKYEDISTSILSNVAQDIFAPTTISGICVESGDLQVVRGNRQIRLMVGQCAGFAFTNTGSGFFSTSRMIVDELPLPRDPLINATFYHPQWAHCTFETISNGFINNGSFTDNPCMFNKTSDSSSVRVTFNGVLRIFNCIDCCMRWYITLNGEECDDPAPIEAILFSTNATGLSVHRGSSITGICSGIPAGPVEAVLNVGPCNGTNETFDAHTGLSSPSFITVEELPEPDGSSSVSGYYPSWMQCTSPKPLNAFVNVSDLMVTNASNFTEIINSDVIQSCSYNKASNDTALKISWDGNIAVLDCENCCVRWFITIDGEECTGPGPIDAAIVQDLTETGQIYDLYRPASLVGICYGTADQGLAPGTRNVQLRVGPCIDSREDIDEAPDLASSFTGLNSVSRFLIEEIPRSNQDCLYELGSLRR